MIITDCENNPDLVKEPDSNDIPDLYQNYNNNFELENQFLEGLQNYIKYMQINYSLYCNCHNLRKVLFFKSLPTMIPSGGYII